MNDFLRALPITVGNPMALVPLGIKIIEICICIGYTIPSGLVAYTWYSSIRFAGVPSLHICRRMLDFDQMRELNVIPADRPHALTTAKAYFITTLLTLVLWWIMDTKFPPGPHVFLYILKGVFTILLFWLTITQLAFIIAHFGFRGVPPAVLFLSSSHQDAHIFQQNIRRSIFPLHLAALLDRAPLVRVGSPQSSTGSPWYLAKEHGATIQPTNDKSYEILQDLYASTYRTPASAQWKPIVLELMTIAPIIIMDARTISSAAREEAAHLLSDTNLMSKTVFVVGDKNEHPLLDVVVSDKAALRRLTLVRAGNLAPFLRQMTHYRGAVLGGRTFRWGTLH